MDKKNMGAVTIQIDNDHSLNFEINNTFKKIINLFLIPILNAIPGSLQKTIKKTHQSAEEVINNATTHKALEVLYHNGHPGKSKHFLNRIFHKIWFSTNNSKAVRNRLKLVKRELIKSVSEILERKDELYLLSIASGSARAVLEIIKDLEIPPKHKIDLHFLDKNPEAIDYSNKLATDLGLKNRHQIKWTIDTVSNFPKHIQKKPDIVEMVGLLDYFDDDKVIKVFSLIHKNMEEGGTFITANIDNNKERKFVTKTVGWNMIYRSGKKLAELAIKSGFKKENIFIYYEPLKIHSILIARK